MARFLVLALAALGSLELSLAQQGNTDPQFQRELDQVLGQSRNLAGQNNRFDNRVCPRGRATLQVTPVKVVRKTPIFVSAFFPRDTRVPIDEHNTLVVRNAPVHVHTIITRTRCSTTTCARLRGARQTGCNLNVIGVIPDPRPTDDPDDCTAVGVTPRCLTTLPTACSNLANTNGLGLITLILGCQTALGAFNQGGLLACLSITPTAATTGQSIVTCLLGALTGTCLNVLPATCISLAGVATISTAAAQACATSLGPLGTGAVANCLAAGGNGNAALLCIQVALGLVGGRDSRGNPCIVGATGGGGLLNDLLGGVGGIVGGLGGVIGGLGNELGEIAK
ncbi:hypothetical protein CP533_3555 [Ophiocordyceps camponoti-saundersi (nom. inval.)]|nr:hypothetical protein CP533_3555 [Ophiocordyceps camponoti-saundersi (nom. inval.)]